MVFSSMQWIMNYLWIWWHWFETFSTTTIATLGLWGKYQIFEWIHFLFSILHVLERQEIKSQFFEFGSSSSRPNDHRISFETSFGKPNNTDFSLVNRGYAPFIPSISFSNLALLIILHSSLQQKSQQCWLSYARGSVHRMFWWQFIGASWMCY